MGRPGLQVDRLIHGDRTGSSARCLHADRRRDRLVAHDTCALVPAHAALAGRPGAHRRDRLAHRWRRGGARPACWCCAGCGVLGVWDDTMITLSIMVVAVLIVAADRHPARHLGGLSTTGRRVHAEAARHRAGDADLRLPLPAGGCCSASAIPPAVDRHRDLRRAARGAPHQPRPAQRAATEHRGGRVVRCTTHNCSPRCSCPSPGGPILLGLNQVIMMAFGIVVIAALLGTGDLGQRRARRAAEGGRRQAFAPGLAHRVRRDRPRPHHHRRTTRKHDSPPPPARQRLLPTSSASALHAVGGRVGRRRASSRSSPSCWGRTTSRRGWTRRHRNARQRRGRVGARQLPQRRARSSAAPGRSATSSSSTCSTPCETSLSAAAWWSSW